MKGRKFLFLLLVMALSACNVYKPIVHVNRYYPPTEYVRILSEPPTDFSSYFGTIKVVPADGSHPTKKDFLRAVDKLKETAQQYGANAIYIRNYDPNYSDMMLIKFIDTWLGGYGAVVEAELYK